MRPYYTLPDLSLDYACEKKHKRIRQIYNKHAHCRIYFTFILWSVCSTQRVGNFPKSFFLLNSFGQALLAVVSFVCDGSFVLCLRSSRYPVLMEWGCALNCAQSSILSKLSFAVKRRNMCAEWKNLLYRDIYIKKFQSNYIYIIVWRILFKINSPDFTIMQDGLFLSLCVGRMWFERS